LKGLSYRRKRKNGTAIRNNKRTQKSRQRIKRQGKATIQRGPHSLMLEQRRYRNGEKGLNKEKDKKLAKGGFIEPRRAVARREAHPRLKSKAKGRCWNEKITRTLTSVQKNELYQAERKVRRQGLVGERKKSTLVMM